jgi:O-antigen/teichoic acid export membrane protein
MIKKTLDALVGFVLPVILVRLITKNVVADFGQVQLLGTTAVSFCNLGFAESVFFFLPAASPEDRKRRTAQIGYILLILGSIAGVVVFFLADPIARSFKNADLAPLIRLFAIFPILDLLQQMLTSALIAIDDAARAIAVGLVSTIAYGAVIVVTFALGCPLMVVLSYSLLVKAIFLLVLLFLALNRPGLILERPSWALWLEIAAYTVPIGLSYNIGLLARRLDQFLISGYFPPDRYAEYFIGAKEIPLLGMLTVSVSTALMPNLVALFKDGRVDEMAGVYRASVRRVSLVILPAFVILLVISQEFILTMYGPKYSWAWYPFVVYLFILPIRVGFYDTVLRATGQTAMLFIGPLIALVLSVGVGVGLMELGRHWYGEDSVFSFVGPAIGAVLASFAASFYFIHLIRRSLRKADFHGSFLPIREYFAILAVSAVAGLVGYGLLLWLRTLPWLDWPPQFRRIAMMAVVAVVILLVFVVLGRRFRVIADQDVASVKVLLRRFGLGRDTPQP